MMSEALFRDTKEKGRWMAALS